MFWIILTTIFLALIIWQFSLKPFRLWKDMGVPHFNPVIFFGDTWPTIFRFKTLPEWMDWIYYKYPESKYIGLYQFTKPILVLRDPELIKLLTIRDFDYFTDHSNFVVSEELDPLWAKNLISLKGQAWRDMRVLLSGSFTSSKMRIMYDLIFKESVKFSQYFKDKNEPTIDVELKECFTRFTNDVIASASFGIEVNSLENPKNEFYKMGQEASNFPSLSFTIKFIAVLVCPWLLKLFGLRFLPRKPSDFFTRIIDDTVKVREEQNIVRPDMINILLEVRKGKSEKTIEKNDITLDTGFAVVHESKTVKPKRSVSITNMDIASHAFVFFLAGFETVSTTMCFACYELVVNPEVQVKLREEIKETYERTQGKPSYEDILRMKYLDMVVTETLRKWPAVVIADRLCVKSYSLEPTKPGEPKINLEPGHSLWMPMYSIQRDPKYYPNPEKFIPERFSDENKNNITPYTYFPFGVGPRACIGNRFALLEIKSVLFHLLNSFAIVPAEKTEIPVRIRKSVLNILPEGGFPLRLERI